MRSRKFGIVSCSRNWATAHDPISQTEAPHANGPYTVEASAEIKIIFPGGTFHRGFGTGQFTNSPLKSEAIKKVRSALMYLPWR